MFKVIRPRRVLLQVSEVGGQVSFNSTKRVFAQRQAKRWLLKIGEPEDLGSELRRVATDVLVGDQLADGCCGELGLVVGWVDGENARVANGASTEDTRLDDGDLKSQWDAFQFVEKGATWKLVLTLMFHEGSSSAASVCA